MPKTEKLKEESGLHQRSIFEFQRFSFSAFIPVWRPRRALTALEGEVKMKSEWHAPFRHMTSSRILQIADIRPEKYGLPANAVRGKLRRRSPVPQDPPQSPQETALVVQRGSGLVTLPHGNSPALSEIIHRSPVHLRTSQSLATRHREPGEECDFAIAPGVMMRMCWIPTN